MFTHFKALKKLLIIFWSEDIHLRVYVSTGLILLITILNLLIPWTLKQVISNLYSNSPSANFIFILVSYGLFWSLSKAIFQVRELISIRVFERSTTKFCLYIFEKLLWMPVSFHVKNNTGGMMHSIDAAQKSIYYILYGIFFAAIPMFLELILMFSIIYINYGFFYALLLIIFPLVYILYSLIMLSRITILQEQTRLKNKKVASYMNDILLNIESIFYQCAENEAYKKLHKIASEKENSSTNTFELLSKVGIGQNIIAGIGLTLMTMIVGLKVMNHQLTPADFILFNGYLVQFIAPLNGLCLIFREVVLGLDKLESILHILDFDNQDAKEQNNFSTEVYSISFDKVFFKYPNQTHDTVHNVSFTIPSGKSIAIVGANGAGKSTIVKLLCKMHELSSGKILIGNTNIANVYSQIIRSKIAVVPQEIFLLDDTIYNNLILGQNGNIDNVLFQELMDATGVADLVKLLPDGYKTKVGERGVKLSGGQKKIIGIARALLKKTKILVLDEASASLDLLAERKITSYLRNIKNITKIFITHKADTLEQMDKVLFLSKGRLISQGTHIKLMNSCKLYVKFWQELED